MSRCEELKCLFEHCGVSGITNNVTQDIKSKVALNINPPLISNNNQFVYSQVPLLFPGDQVVYTGTNLTINGNTPTYSNYEVPIPINKNYFATNIDGCFVDGDYLSLPPGNYSIEVAYQWNTSSSFTSSSQSSSILDSNGNTIYPATGQPYELVFSYQTNSSLSNVVTTNIYLVDDMGNTISNIIPIVNNMDFLIHNYFSKNLYNNYTFVVSLNKQTKFRPILQLLNIIPSISSMSNYSLTVAAQIPGSGINASKVKILKI